MALKACPECGNAVSTKARACPSCGVGLTPSGLDTSLAGNAQSCLGCIVLVVILIVVAFVLGSF